MFFIIVFRVVIIPQFVIAYLIITLPDLGSRAPIILSAKAINPQITIISRARYLTERGALETSGADHDSQRRPARSIQGL